MAKGTQKKQSTVNMAKTNKIAEPKKSFPETSKGRGITEKIFSFGKTQVTATHLDKIYFPEDGITKGDIIKYYISLSSVILPYLKGRPESLLRNPNGLNDKGFFQKDAGRNVPSYVDCKKIFSESNQKKIGYIICNNQATLTYLNNLGCIEINPWHSTVQALNKPDYLILDIDPSENNTFEQVIEVANVIKQILDKAGAKCFCKTSGKTGLHIYIPAAKKYTYKQIKDFAHHVCTLTHEELPNLSTLERNLEKRSKDHIYLDFLQNSEGQTIASAYSVRPIKGATVSAPLMWNEVRPGLSPNQFSINNMLERLNKIGDIFKDVLGKGFDLEKCITRLDA